MPNTGGQQQLRRRRSKADRIFMALLAVSAGPAQWQWPGHIPAQLTSGLQSPDHSSDNWHTRGGWPGLASGRLAWQIVSGHQEMDPDNLLSSARTRLGTFMK